MTRIHFIDGSVVDLHNVSYEYLSGLLGMVTKEKFLRFSEAIIAVDKIVYIERMEIEG